jgi:membrane-associated phospholipid phosphatase
VHFILFVLVFLVLWGLLSVVLPPLWRLLATVAKRAASMSMRSGIVQRTVRAAGPVRNYLPVVVLLVAGGVIAGFAGDNFLDLAERVRSHSPRLQAFDTRIHDWAVGRREDEATLFFDAMSAIGGPAGLTIIASIVTALLLWKRRFWWIGYLAATAGGGALLDAELKRYFARSRPDVAEMLMRASGYSFPSGHAMGSTVVFAALSYLAVRALPRWWQRAAVISLAWSLILSVSLSRVYLGVHWISDVTAGIVGGVLWVTVATVAFETLRRIRTIRAGRRGIVDHEVSA